MAQEIPMHNSLFMSCLFKFLFPQKSSIKVAKGFYALGKKKKEAI